MKKIKLKEKELTRIIERVIKEQTYTPEDRVVRKQCTVPGTSTTVQRAYNTLTRRYGYECVGQKASEVSNAKPPLTLYSVLLKKSIQGVTLYVEIAETDWDRMQKIGDLSWYAPAYKTEYFEWEGGEGRLDTLYDLDVIEGEILSSTGD